MKGTFIFVLDRGFVVVGEAEIDGDLSFHWHMPRSVTVRQWGTTKGLAELKDGPLTGTVLDAVCERHTPFRSVLDIICLTPEGVEAWMNVLSASRSTPTRARR